jgi:hypothetical protein
MRHPPKAFASAKCLRLGVKMLSERQNFLRGMYFHAPAKYCCLFSPLQCSDGRIDDRADIVERISFRICSRFIRSNRFKDRSVFLVTRMRP